MYYLLPMMEFTAPEIWVSNGAEQSTRLMSEIEPGINGSDPSENI
jgi:ELWxxDGT repeat protein